MAGDFSKPVSTDTYASLLQFIRENFTELAKLLDGSTADNIPTGAVRFNSTSRRFERYDGTTWAELVVQATSAFDMRVSKADSLTAARTISLTGDASGSASFDGSSNASITVDVANNSHTHDHTTVSAAADVYIASGLSAKTQGQVGPSATGGVTDANSYLNAGIYFVASANAVTNFPVANVGGHLQVLADSTGNIRQEFTRYDTSSVYVRTRTAAGVWTSWLSVATGSISSFPAGTRMLFQQSTAPTGWTKDTSINDKALRVVSGAAGSGGSVAFSTVFGRTATDGTTLTVAQMPSHQHGIYKFSAAGNSGTYITSSSLSSAENRVMDTNLCSSVGGNGSHTHGLDLRLAYVDIIIATKD